MAPSLNTSSCFKKLDETHPDYPEALRDLVRRPTSLYVMGRWPLPHAPVFGIVGTRRATSYGLRMARELAHDLVEAGAIIVSGMASGIDAAAHEAALEAGGMTVGVLGHGLNHEYPAENKSLFKEMKAKGTLLSEFSPEMEPRPAYFPQRNRIISGLSKGVIVVEAGKPSGAMITARFAAEQGRDVFAVPGSVYSAQSVGCHALIKEGVKLVETAEDILVEYGELFPGPGVSRPIDPDRLRGLDSIEKKVLLALSQVPTPLDDLMQATGLSVDQLARTLLSLELKNLAEAFSGQRYGIKN